MVYISPETVANFKAMFKKEYGVEYSDEDAWEATHNLLSFFELLMKIDQRIRRQNSEKQGGVDIQP